MKLENLYHKAIKNKQGVEDSNQRAVLVHFQRLDDALHKNQWWPSTIMRDRKGIYLYGSVGSGKTFLADLFYQQSTVTKARYHFHHFMQQVDLALRALQGKKDPLLIFAANFAKKHRLLFLDEFLVHDIAHAMILAELLQALFYHEVVLITTSNTNVDDLYQGGLQRARFLPAIELIKKHCEVIFLKSGIDYRLDKEIALQTYLSPHDEHSIGLIKRQFNAMATMVKENGTILVQSRYIPYVRCGETVIWFQFEIICTLGRSQLDYLELSERFTTIIISNVPQFTSNNASALMFASLIDVFYDKKLRLVLSAQVPLAKIYKTEELQKLFARTFSRLQEMQSQEYLK